MYILDPAKKNDPKTRWQLPHRIFFGHGACHILAGVYVQQNIGADFKPFWIKPYLHPGNHIFVSDGQVAFDYHGYSACERLLAHHKKVWTHQYPDWQASIEPVEFDLLDTTALNQRNMRGADQYYANPIPRARQFIARYDHTALITQTKKRILNLQTREQHA